MFNSNTYLKHSAVGTFELACWCTSVLDNLGISLMRKGSRGLGENLGCTSKTASICCLAESVEFGACRHPSFDCGKYLFGLNRSNN